MNRSLTMLSAVRFSTLKAILNGLLASASLLLAVTNSASTLEIRLFDQKNEPLPNAVVTLSAADMDRTELPSVRTADIAQINQEFVPEVTVVQAGTAISFPNNDDILHHVYSFSESNTFDLPLYQGTPSTPVIFDKPGLVTLGCNIHDWMRAYVVVVDTAYYQTSDNSGKLVIENIPEGPYQMEIWHPRQRSAYSENIDIGLQTKVEIEIPSKPKLRSRRHGSGQSGGYSN